VVVVVVVVVIVVVAVVVIKQTANADPVNNLKKEQITSYQHA